jgi:hypothetical protein
MRPVDFIAEDAVRVPGTIQEREPVGVIAGYFSKPNSRAALAAAATGSGVGYSVEWLVTVSDSLEGALPPAEAGVALLAGATG